MTGAAQLGSSHPHSTPLPEVSIDAHPVTDSFEVDATNVEEYAQDFSQPRRWIDDFCGKRGSIVGIALGYCLSASLLSIINKWAIVNFPFPGLLTALQYLTSAAAVFCLGKFGILEYDPITVQMMIKFLPAAICFYASLFTNSELLLNANVDTFIVFRSAVPIFVAAGETLFLKQPWPSVRTWLSLLVIFGGSVVYVLAESRLTVKAYAWAFAYLASMTIDFVYIKHVVSTIGLSTWGLVLYNNLEALLLFPLELLVMGEGWQLMKEFHVQSVPWMSATVWFPVGLSCAFGLSISFFGFACRREISATSFTVLGVVNKLLTVLINLVVWSKHAPALGTSGLLLCICGGILYQNSVEKAKAQHLVESTDEESSSLVNGESELKGLIEESSSLVNGEPELKGLIEESSMEKA